LVATDGWVHRARVVEEGARAADYLLTMCVRALDYTPPVHLEFGDFLSAVLTADAEIRPDDSQYEFRTHLRKSFRAYGIEPASKGSSQAPGSWTPAANLALEFSRTHFEPMQRDPDEVFWFVWENRKALDINEGAYGHVISVRPCLRIAPDGFPLRETVAEFVQTAALTADQLTPLGIKAPEGMPPAQSVYLQGGNTLVFDEYGRLKYNIHNYIFDKPRQSARLRYLWNAGYLETRRGARGFAALHLRRTSGASAAPRSEQW
jgi:hypothetical protein